MADYTDWGVQFDVYSQDRLEPRASNLSEQEAERFRDIHQIPHLRALEMELYECSVDGRIPSSADTQALLSIVWRFINITKHKEYSLLKYYYGFLCLRLLIYFACCTVLARKSTLSGDNSEPLQPNESLNSRLQATAFAALDGASNDQASFIEFCETFARSGFLFDSETRNITCLVVSRVLWDDRDKFLTLCLRGLLPGCSLLLLAAAIGLNMDLEVLKFTSTGFLLVQDLGFRLYLAGSHRDRQVLQPVCMASVKNSIHWPKESNRVVNSDDSQALSRAYSGLLFVWKQNGWSTKSLPVDFLGHLTAFVLHVHGHNLSTSAQERIETIEIALQFLWMVLGDRGRIPLSDHSKVREFAIAVFSHLWNTQQRITTREEQYMIAQALAEVEFTALAGRVLLMILDEGNEFQNTESFTDLLDGIHAFQEVIDKSVSVSPGLLIDSEIEWGKVFIHLGRWSILGYLNLDPSDPNYEDIVSRMESEIFRRISQTWRAWSHYGRNSLTGSDGCTPQDCGYPRCFDSVTREWMLKARHVCGKCNQVAYCSANCQRRHWELKSSDAHRLQCLGSGAGS